MESNHIFKTEKLAANDDNFKPYTGELPSRFKALNERANERYQNMLPATVIKLKGVLSCINSAVLRTAYTLDTQNNPLNVANDDAYDVHEDTKESFLTPKYA